MKQSHSGATGDTMIDIQKRERRTQLALKRNSDAPVCILDQNMEPQVTLSLINLHDTVNSSLLCDDATSHQTATTSPSGSVESLMERPHFHKQC